MTSFFYSIFVELFQLGIKMAAFFNPKAKKWIVGRNQWAYRLKEEIDKKLEQGNPMVWIHSASSGEFEQAKPIIEKLKKSNPQTCILVSFFSPSGMEASKNYLFADITCYLPLDRRANANRFLDIVNPDVVLWIKYEYWWHFLGQIHKRGIPLLLVSAIFQRRQPFFHWYGNFHRKMLGFFKTIFVQDLPSKELLRAIGFEENVVVNGDTRFDRVMEIAADWKPVKEMEAWLKGNHKVVVAGSTWPDDEKVIKHLASTKVDVKWVIVPHHVDDYSIKETLERFPKALLFSDMMAGEKGEAQIVIVDTIGYLSRLYRYADICFIGGGFASTGIHNTLEAAVYARPLIFGPEYEEYAEAVGLVKSGGAISVSNVLDWEANMNRLLSDKEASEKMGKLALHFVLENIGATNSIVDYIYKNRLLTK
jgi:3-deoxy-D-manno-octulosonic-acid transferase